MKDLEKVNEDPRFREFMTKEEDERKIRNTELYAAREERSKQEKIEIAKRMQALNIPIEQIIKVTNLSKKEIESLE